jgi:DNA-binding NtrC family response regulator
LPAHEIDETINKSDEPQKPLKPQKSGKNVLFVDDEELIVEIAQQLFESLGYKIECMTSSVKALELFQSKPNSFDLVITDMTMPDMNGDKLIKKILEIRPDTPTILCTGYSELVSEEEAKALGVKAFLMKPFKRDYVGKIVRQVLDKNNL